MQTPSKLLAIVGSSLAILAAGRLAYSTPAKDPYVMVPAGAAKFAPLDPKNPRGL